MRPKFTRLLFCLLSMLFILSLWGVGASAKVTVTMWAFPIFQDDMAEFFGPIIQKFEKENPDIAVKIEFFPWEARAERMMTAIASKSAPDVAYLNEDIFPTYADIGALVPLDKYMTQEDLKDFKALGALKWKGELYVLPILQNIHIPTYNKAHIAKAGADAKNLPQSWQEVTALMKKLTSVVKYPLSIGILDFSPSYWGPLFLQAGGQYFPDGKRFSVNTEAGLRALKQTVSWVNEFAGPAAKGMKETEANDLFFNGMTSLTYNFQQQWYWTTNYQALANPKIKDDIVFGPIWKDKVKATNGTVAGYGVFSQSKNPEAAVKWVKFLTNTENMVTFAKKTGFLAPRRSADTQLKKILNDPHFDIVADESPYAHGYFAIHPQSRAVRPYLSAEIEAAILGKKTPEQALKDADKAINDMMARYKPVSK